MIYNIAYGTGGPSTALGNIGTGYRYLRSTERNLERLIEFIQSENPDILGLLEVDVGSYRTGTLNQAEEIASGLSHYHLSAVKYPAGSMGSKMPVFKHQGNALLTRESTTKNLFHFLDSGFKRLVIEAEYEGLSIFLVHLSLRRNIRRRQLAALAELVAGKPRLVVAGDFNALSGADELREFRGDLGLATANPLGTPTYPSWKPSKELDFILHSRDVAVDALSIPKVGYSDHLPMILEISIDPLGKTDATAKE